MPRVIDGAEQTACEPGDCIAALEASGFDPGDEASLLHAAGWLRRLGLNRAFLAEHLLDELKARHGEDDAAGSYGPQVVLLSPIRGDFFLRANIWPSRDEHMFRASGGGTFVYELPHDHNFDFLTYGYFGPGDWSDYWEYDYEAVAGAPGASEPFLRIAVGLGCEEARDLAERFAAGHPSDRMRLTALDAQAGVLGLAERDELWRRAEGSGSRLVALEARRRRDSLAET